MKLFSVTSVFERFAPQIVGIKKNLIAPADNSSTCMQVDMKDTGSRFVGSQFIFRFDFQLKIFNNSYFILTCLSAYLRVFRLLMITRLCNGALTFMIQKSERTGERVRTRTLELYNILIFKWI